jgi:hypothetical protein
MRWFASSRRWQFLLVLGLAVVGVAAGVSLAMANFLTTDSGTTIQACANSTNGLLRLVNTPGDCRVNEKSISWPAQAGGGALGFAVIGSDGSLDASRSKGVSAVTLGTGPLTGGINLRTLCLQLDAATRAAVNLVNVQNVGVINPFSSSAGSVPASLAADTNAALIALTGCPAGTDAFIAIGSVQNGSRSGPYYVVFN